jgi:hypothetical protein
MRFHRNLPIVLALITLTAPGCSRVTPENPDAAASYWLFVNHAGDWCGYTDEARFGRELAAQTPPVLQGAKVSFKGGKVTGLQHDINGAGGSFRVVDVLTPQGEDWTVQRWLDFGGGPQVVAQNTLHQGRPGPWQTLPAGAPPNRRFDPGSRFPVMAPQAMPFMPVVDAMRAQSTDFLCMPVKKGPDTAPHPGAPATPHPGAPAAH